MNKRLLIPKEELISFNNSSQELNINFIENNPKILPNKDILDILIFILFYAILNFLNY